MVVAIIAVMLESLHATIDPPYRRPWSPVASAITAPTGEYPRDVR